MILKYFYVLPGVEETGHSYCDNLNSAVAIGTAQEEEGLYMMCLCEGRLDRQRNGGVALGFFVSCLCTPGCLINTCTHTLCS